METNLVGECRHDRTDREQSGESLAPGDVCDQQDGANQVSIITNTAERQAAIGFAKAGAIRPAIVGAALQKVSQDAEVASALFEVLEAQKIIAGEARMMILPEGSALLSDVLAANAAMEHPPALKETAVKV